MDGRDLLLSFDMQKYNQIYLNGLNLIGTA